MVLDNLEQVIEAAPDIGILLGSAPDLVLFLSSPPVANRLSISGEHVYQVPPLDLPPTPHPNPHSTVLDSPARSDSR